MLVKTRLQNQFSGLVSISSFIGEFDLPGLKVVAGQRVGIYRIERVSATRVTLSDPSATMSNDNVVREVSVHGNPYSGNVGSSGQRNRPGEIGGRV